MRGEGTTAMTFGHMRLWLRTAALGACGLALAGCVGPTYGTGATQGEQLLSDFDGLLALGSTNKAKIDYTPRPELVKPARIGDLPPPRDTQLAAADPNWPESPEARSARIRAAAPGVGSGADEALSVGYATKLDKEGYDPRVEEGRRGQPAAGHRTEYENSWVSPKNLAGAGEQARERAKIGRQGSPVQRQFLSEPPLAYRAPSEAAPVGDVGTDEEVKERRLKGTTSLGTKLRNILPF